MSSLVSSINRVLDHYLPGNIRLRRIAIIVPTCFLIGAGMEFTMIKSGFYEIVTRKEAERRAEAQKVLAEYSKQNPVK